jgi:hypothetical protein
VAARFKAWVYGRSLPGIMDSNAAGGIDICFECCALSDSPMRRADHLSREGLPSVCVCVFVCVCVSN